MRVVGAGLAGGENAKTALLEIGMLEEVAIDEFAEVGFGGLQEIDNAAFCIELKLGEIAHFQNARGFQIDLPDDDGLALFGEGYRYVYQSRGSADSAFIGVERDVIGH